MHQRKPTRENKYIHFSKWKQVSRPLGPKRSRDQSFCRVAARRPCAASGRCKRSSGLSTTTSSPGRECGTQRAGLGGAGLGQRNQILGWGLGVWGMGSLVSCGLPFEWNSADQEPIWRKVLRSLKTHWRCQVSMGSQCPDRWWPEHSPNSAWKPG